MKRVWAAIVILLLIVSLTACSQEEPQTVYTVEIANNSYTVDTQNLTISDGIHTYHYTVISGGNSVKTTITYPNGGTYYWSWQGNVGSGGWSADYDNTIYADGHELVRAVEHYDSLVPQKREYSGHPLLGLLCIALGLWNILSPYSSWYFNHGWRYKDAEPSDASLEMTRLGGIAGIIIGVILFFA